MRNLIKQNGKKGFTLIEMMVAVSIFVIVAFIVVSTLLTLSYAYKKAQKMYLLLDNLGFSVQSMSLNIREGINYNKTTTPCSDPNGCNFMSFKPMDSYLAPDLSDGESICFSLLERGDGTHGIEKCKDKCPCDGDGVDIISSDIDITRLNFKVEKIGAKSKVLIMIGGNAGKNREATHFFIQNTVAQRNVNQ